MTGVGGEGYAGVPAARHSGAPHERPQGVRPAPPWEVPTQPRRRRDGLAEAVAGLVEYARARPALAAYALDAALRLVGGDAGAIVDGTGEVLATVALSTAEAITLAARCHVSGRPLRVRASDGRPRAIIGMPIASSAGLGMLVVRQRVRPPWRRRHDATRLHHFTVAVATALDRVRMSERLHRQSSLHESMLQALSDLGQGFIISDRTRVLYVNGAVVELTGRPEADLLRMRSYHDLCATSPTRLERPDGATLDIETATKSMGEFTVTVVRDVTERLQKDRVLRLSEERFRLLVEGVRDYAIYMLDPNGRVESWNAGAQRIYGWGAAEVHNRPESLFFVDDGPTVLPDLLRAAAYDGHLEVEGWRVRKDGTRFFASTVMTALVHDDGTQRGFAVVVRDVTERQAAQAALAHQAMHDDLTGLANRTLFVDRLQQALARIDETSTTVAVLFMDLDHFKTINDSLGHRAGDEVLVGAAARLMATVRPGDTVARFGGDEFVVLCDGVSSADHAVSIANRIAEVVTRPYPIPGDSVCVSLSMGIALAVEAGDRADALLRDADAALYRAKELGRNRIEVFDDTLRARAVERLETENGLRRAVTRGELCVLYQPEVALNDQRIVAFEALVRWQHPTLGLVPPSHFVPIAEESGLIVPIGNWVIEEACRQHAQWRAARPDAATVVAVNLSARQLAQPDLVAVVASALSGTGTDPALLGLEITESVLMDDIEATMATLRALKDLGVQLAVDDFGTGYSSLSYLKRFPVDVLKIDRSFVAGVGDDPEDSAIVAAVTKMGHTLGLTVVAEGVETAVQVRGLRRLRCDIAQGNFFSGPLSPEDAGAHLGAGRPLAIAAL